MVISRFNFIFNLNAFPFFSVVASSVDPGAASQRTGHHCQSGTTTMNVVVAEDLNLECFIRNRLSVDRSFSTHPYVHCVAVAAVGIAANAILLHRHNIYLPYFIAG